MKTLKLFRTLTLTSLTALTSFAFTTNQMVDTPVGESGSTPSIERTAPVVTEVVQAPVQPEASVAEAPVVPKAAPSRTQRTRSTRTAPSPAPRPMVDGDINAMSQVSPLSPDLSALSPIDGELMLSNDVEASAANEPVAPADNPTEVAVHVVDWELSELVSNLTVQTGVNIVLASTQNPKVTVRLEKMPIRDVVRIIASIANMQVIQMKSGGFVIAPGDVLQKAFPVEYQAQIIAPAAATAPNPTNLGGVNTGQGGVEVRPPANREAVQVYDVKHVQASQLADTLLAVFKDDGLVVRVGPGKLLPSPINGTGSSGSDSGSSGGSTPTSLPGEATTGSGGTGRSIIVRGPKAAVDAAIALASQLDVKQPQVSIRVQIHDISNDALRDLGVSWQSNTPTTITENNSSVGDINFGRFTRSPLSFQATLRHLETSEKAKILAQPNLSVLDQEPGYILIGDRINFPVVTSLNSNGQPVFDVREERVGIYLQVSATVNDKSEVTLNLYPQVSTITGFLEVPGQGSYPQISTREAKTSIRIKSGETVMIGGLLRDEEIRTVERVPILGRIPIFGELFTRRKTTKNQSQVVISITPQIIESEQ